MPNTHDRKIVCGNSFYLYVAGKGYFVPTQHGLVSVDPRSSRALRFYLAEDLRKRMIRRARPWARL